MSLLSIQSPRKMSTRNLLGVKGGRGVMLTILLPSVSQISRKWGIPDVSQPYGPSPPDRGAALHLSIDSKYMDVNLILLLIRRKYFVAAVSCYRHPA
jgi:hypothetical protein